MYGEEFLPQPSILPQCDLLITHGGNNTTSEGFNFGLPMIGLPLFWDQYDNAQRLQETGYGVRLPTYDWTDEELIGAVDRLLADEDLHARMRAIAERIQASPGRLKGADLIEQVLQTGEPATR
jgi:UDP:flavonoid glycosyltransferase YjiC (YdhE family)